jgi:hypothetical protein
VNYSNGGPTVVSYPVVLETLQYIQRIRELGAFEGPIGDMKVNPDVARALEIVHQVLAGATLDEVKYASRGNPDIVRELNEMVARGGAAANEINRKAGYYVTLIA